ncbi:hypothetical protein ACS0TY_015622 [Phlomoides rotata]
MVAKILGLACVNLSEMVMGLGSNMIGRIAFGSKYDVQSFQTRGFDALLHEAQNLDLFYQELIDEHLENKRLKKMEEEEDNVDVLIKLKEEKPCSIHITWNHIKAMLTV